MAIGGAAVLAGDENSELVELSNRGDADAIIRLLGIHYPRLKRMVSIRLDRRLAARIDPSDVVQEGLAEAVKRLPRYLVERPLPLYPWLRRLTWEKLLQLHQHHLLVQKRNPRREQPWELPYESSIQLAERLIAQDSGPSEVIERRELCEQVHRALAELPALDREVLSLRYLEQLSIEEATAVLGISTDTFMKRHWRAIQRIRRLMGA